MFRAADFYDIRIIAYICRRYSRLEISFVMEGKIKNVIFDFGGVIINLMRNRCIDAFEQLGIANLREQLVGSMLGDVSAEKLELLLALRQRYTIYLLSNTNVIHWEWAERNSFAYKNYRAADFFKRIYLSFQIHQLKPDAGIFEYVLQDAGICPEETFFIDDSLPNCRTAESLGIQTYTPQPREDWSHLFK